MKLLIKNANLWQWINSDSKPITSNNRYKGKNIPNCWLTLENGWITQVGCTNNDNNICDMINNIVIDKFPTNDNFDQVIDANGQFVIPGITNQLSNYLTIYPSNYLSARSSGCSYTYQHAW
jgi:hypothetical protein